MTPDTGNVIHDIYFFLFSFYLSVSVLFGNIATIHKRQNFLVFPVCGI